MIVPILGMKMANTRHKLITAVFTASTCFQLQTALNTTSHSQASHHNTLSFPTLGIIFLPDIELPAHGVGSFHPGRNHAGFHQKSVDQNYIMSTVERNR